MEGLKQMIDLLLGVIIGGAIGLIGSWIQGHYSLKGRREENSSRERQQSTQIQHEKDTQLLSRRIALRSKYLEPLNTHVSALYTAFDDHRTKLIGLIGTYGIGADKIKVDQSHAQEFARQLQHIEPTFDAMSTTLDKIRNLMPQVGDPDLLALYTGLLEATNAFYKSNVEMSRSLGAIEQGHDFVYDFDGIMNSISAIRSSVSSMQRRIESLLAGVD